MWTRPPSLMALVLSILALRHLAEFRQEPDLTKKVSFDHLARPAGRLIPLLAEESGIRLVCSNIVAPDVLLITARDVPLSEVMDKIAYVSGAQWTKIDGGFRLTRDLVLSRAQEHADTLQRAAELRK